MNRISPQQHADSEARTERRARAVVAAVIAAVICASAWFSGLSGGAQLTNTEDVNSTSPEFELTPTAPSAAQDTWQGDLREIETTVSPAASGEIQETLHTSINSVLSHLSEHEVSPDSEHGGEVTAMIKELERRVDIPEGARDPSVDVRQLVLELEREISVLTEREQVETAQAIERATAKVQEETAAGLRDARLAARDAEDSVAHLRDQIARKREELNRQAAKAARTAALAADMPAIKSYLSPFITSGHVQPKGVRGGVVEHTPEAMPVSLRRLETRGALEPDLEGLGQLFRFGGSYKTASRNDRPRGAFPAYGWHGDIKKPDVLAAVKFAQQLLRKHGQALVEARLLSP